MIQKNSDWHKNPEVIKGDFGENIVQRFFEKQGYKVYKSVTDAPHPFDFICIKNNETFYFEVKTKARRNKYPDTGFNFNQYKVYKAISEKEGKPIYICFVDHVLKKIYGNFLNILDKERVCNGKKYPSNEPANNGTIIRYYPLEVMQDMGLLSDKTIQRLKSFSTCQESPEKNTSKNKG